MFTIIFLLFTIYLTFSKGQKFIRAFLIKDGVLKVVEKTWVNLDKGTISDARLITSAALILSNFITIGYAISYLAVVGINNITIIYTIFLIASTMYFSALFERQVQHQKTTFLMAFKMIEIEYSNLSLVSDLIEVAAMIYFVLSLMP